MKLENINHTKPRDSTFNTWISSDPLDKYFYVARVFSIALLNSGIVVLISFGAASNEASVNWLASVR
jgi:hypothetical protein